MLLGEHVSGAVGGAGVIGTVTSGERVFRRGSRYAHMLWPRITGLSRHMKCACLQVTVDDAGNGAVAATQVKSLLQTTTTTTTTHSEQLSLLAAGREKLKQKRERKAARTLVSVWSVSRYGGQGAARTLAIVTGTFVVCWLPFFIVATWQIRRIHLGRSSSSPLFNRSTPFRKPTRPHVPDNPPNLT